MSYYFYLVTHRSPRPPAARALRGLCYVLHPVPHTLPSLTLHPVRPHISRSLEGLRAGGGADERRAPRHAGAQTIRRGGRLWGVRGRAPCSSCTPARSRVGVVEAPPCPCALAVLHSHRITCRPKGSGRGWTVVEARQLGVGSVSARAWRPDGPGGSGWMRRRRTSAARPHDSSRAHARPLCSQPTSPGRSARAGAWGGCGPRLVERAAEPEV